MGFWILDFGFWISDCADDAVDESNALVPLTLALFPKGERGEESGWLGRMLALPRSADWLARTLALPSVLAVPLRNLVWH